MKVFALREKFYKGFCTRIGLRKDELFDVKCKIWGFPSKIVFDGFAFISG